LIKLDGRAENGRQASKEKTENEYGRWLLDWSYGERRERVEELGRQEPAFRHRFNGYDVASSADLCWTHTISDVTWDI